MLFLFFCDCFLLFHWFYFLPELCVGVVGEVVVVCGDRVVWCFVIASGGGRSSCSEPIVSCSRWSWGSRRSCARWRNSCCSRGSVYCSRLSTWVHTYTTRGICILVIYDHVIIYDPWSCDHIRNVVIILFFYISILILLITLPYSVQLCWKPRKVNSAPSFYNIFDIIIILLIWFLDLCHFFLLFIEDKNSNEC